MIDTEIETFGKIWLDTIDLYKVHLTNDFASGASISSDDIKRAFDVLKYFEMWEIKLAIKTIISDTKNNAMPGADDVLRVCHEQAGLTLD